MLQCMPPASPHKVCFTFSAGTHSRYFNHSVSRHSSPHSFCPEFSELPQRSQCHVEQLCRAKLSQGLEHLCIDRGLLVIVTRSLDAGMGTSSHRPESLHLHTAGRGCKLGGKIPKQFLVLGILPSPTQPCSSVRRQHPSQRVTGVMIQALQPGLWSWRGGHGDILQGP